MSQSSPYILLKLLSGLNAGAEMELAPGDWVIGSDEESHLLILDAGVSPQHLLLHVQPDGGVTLLPKNGTALAAGKPLPPEGAAIPPFEVFTVGGTQMAYGPAQGVWPEISLPALVTARPAEDNAPQEAQDAGAEPAENPDEAAGASARTRVTSAHNVGGNKVGGNAASSAPKKRNYLRLGALAFLVVLLLALVLDYTQFGFIFTDAERDAAALAKNLQRRGFAHVTVSPQQDGSLLIKGAVPSNATMDALVSYVERTGKKADISIISLEDLVAALTAKARRLDAPLSVTRSGFKVRVRGYAYDMLALEDVLKDESEALSLVPSQIDVMTWEKAVKELRGMIASKNLENKVRLLPELYRITLQSQPLTKEEQQRLIALMREIDDFFGVEGLVAVERWRVVAKTAPRKPQNAKTMIIQPTVAGELPGPIRFLMPTPTAAQPASAQGPTQGSPRTAQGLVAENNAAPAAGARRQIRIGPQSSEGENAAPAPQSGQIQILPLSPQGESAAASSRQTAPLTRPAQTTGLGQSAGAEAPGRPEAGVQASGTALAAPLGGRATEPSNAFVASEGSIPFLAAMPLTTPSATTPAATPSASEDAPAGAHSADSDSRSAVYAPPVVAFPGADSGAVDLSHIPLAPGMAEGLGIPGLPATQPQFTCAQLRLEGEGPRMAVVYAGVRYRTGAKLPGDLQVKLITPSHVVLQRGKTYTRICAAGEIAKEKRK